MKNLKLTENSTYLMIKSSWKWEFYKEAKKLKCNDPIH